MRLTPGHLLVIVLAFGVGLGVLFSPSASAQKKPSLSTLRAWQKKVQNATDRGRQTVVGVSGFRGAVVGSGVIVSADGVVLTAAHVVAELGQRLIIHLPDGRRVPARSLGRHTNLDAAVAKIEARPGQTFPFAQMETRSVDPGQWVVSIGHTAGYQKDRPAPVRLGRVLQNETSNISGGFVFTDCTLAGGDSGGGLFDLEGKLVGVHSQIGQNLLENLHIPIQAFRERWMPLMQGRIMNDGPPIIHIAPEDEDIDYDQIDPMFDELLSHFPRGEAPRFMMLPVKPGGPPPKQAKEFDSLLKVLQPVVRNAAAATVEIFDSKNPREPICLGTVVRSSGVVLTKASEVFGRTIKARLPSGKVVSADIRYYRHDHDLALLKIGVNKSPFVRFAEEGVPTGSFLAAPGIDGVPVSIGVKSVKARKIASPQNGFLGVMIDDADSTAGSRITRVLPDSPAKAAGLRVGDLITLVDRQRIRNSADLIRIISDARPGSPVLVQFSRRGTPQKVQVKLANREDSDANAIFMNLSQFFGSELSSHRSNYPSVIQHDLTLLPNQTGGPLVDLEGRPIGMNIARAGRTKSYAIPGGVLNQVLSDRASWTPVADR